MTSLFILQRATALLLGPLVLGHLVVIVIAVRDGLTAAEILDRTSGHTGWMLFYGLFVIIACVHGAIGVRTIAQEWSDWPTRRIDVCVVAGACVIAALGLRAVAAVTMT